MPLEALTTFKNYFKSAVSKTLTKDAISKAASIVTPILNKESISNISQNAVSNLYATLAS